MADKRFPELEVLVAPLEKERDEILKASEPLLREREALLSKIQPLEVQLREVDIKIKKLQRPRLSQVTRQLAVIAKAMGGRSMQAGTANLGAEGNTADMA